jgi:hypothetical protein
MSPIGRQPPNEPNDTPLHHNSNPYRWNNMVSTSAPGRADERQSHET